MATGAFERFVVAPGFGKAFAEGDAAFGDVGRIGGGGVANFELLKVIGALDDALAERFLGPVRSKRKSQAAILALGMVDCSTTRVKEAAGSAAK